MEETWQILAICEILEGSKMASSAARQIAEQLGSLVPILRKIGATDVAERVRMLENELASYPTDLIPC